MLEARAITATHGRRIVLENASLALPAGEIVGLSGPSGQGKTTLGRVLAGLHRPSAGVITMDGAVPDFRAVQYLYQDPLSAMNPRWRIGRIITEGQDTSPDLRAAIGVPAAWHDRFPHELSGGQLQRVALLRALALRPRYLVADEITSALDPLSQLHIWRLLQRVARDQCVGILAISHDRALLGQICTLGQVTL
ncbi:peptide/nickel transport system ATP-binding protein [Ketogulonicigenium robustum]|uniref:Peptide/nickel transport system ATP-binding protein n=1 Tax=Ketogulonicigenium robustum TaxID=92947 RepID=A0A1W6NZ61_9RHOB|nr:ATP-binding cassette domain-containing protein [Ketogulonicigenium robustum]ARO14479.1 peptide/nickel transport system ATP-binding protein [Ketogulonicigenium robustum]